MSEQSFEIRTANVDKVRQTMAGLFCPFQLTVNAAIDEVRLRHDPLDALSFTTLAYGSSVDIEVDERQSRFLMQIPLTGVFEVRTAGPWHRVTSTTAQTIPPKTPFHMRCSPDCTILVVNTDARDLEFQARVLIGDDVDLATIVPDIVPFAGAGTTLGRYVEFLYAEARCPDSLLRHGPGARPAIQALLAMLMQSFNIREHVPRSGRAWYVKRAEAFMEQNLANPIGICDVVASSGVSMRTLYHGFHTCHGVAPMTWLKQRRLARVHDDLRSADPRHANVTDVATRWGFFHLGRFAADYRARFGLLPSQTLRRR